MARYGHRHRVGRCRPLCHEHDEILPDGNVIPISRGWGSVSDKQGINKVLRYERAGVLYADLFG